MTPLRPEQARQMLALQYQMNATVNPDWLNANYPFLRAVIVEVGEALEHLGWKWWKKQSTDIDQTSIELIDILHFMLSHALIEAKGNIDLAAANLANASDPARLSLNFDGRTYFLNTDPRNLFELLAGLAASRRNELCVLEACFKAFSLNWDNVYIKYISKNVLNIFRQENGYKSGTYIKEWFGREDNIYLVELITHFDPSSNTFSEDIRRALTMQYDKVLQAQG